MKRILLICAGLFIALGANAQIPGMGGGSTATKITGRINAVILDSLTNQPIDYATVSLIKVKDGKTVNGGVTDAKGKITLQNVAPDEYKLAIGFIGYKNKSVIVKTTPTKPDNTMGNVLLSPTSNTLNEVVVEGKKAIIENKIDRLVYNAEADATNAGGDATDVMRKVPMLSVDVNGNVQLRGGAVRVLINGKPSGTMANSVADALKMLPAEQIKSVEVITSPSAKYDAEGSGGIINIITKKSNAQGVSGSVNAAAGTRQNNGSFNLTAKTNRLSVNTALGGSYAYPQNTRVEMFNQTGNTTTIQNGYSKWERPGYNGSLGVDYDINAYNNISSNIKYSHFNNGGPGQNDIFINGVPSTNISNMDMGFNNMDWNVDYKLTTKKVGEEFTVSGQWSQGRNTTDYTNIFRASGVPDFTLLNNNVGKNNEYTAQTDYVLPLSKKTTLETGVKGIFRDIKSDYTENSQDFDYNQDVASAYGVLSFNLTKKIQVKGGLRAEYTKIDGVFANSLPIENDYFNLFPSVVISQNLKGGSTIKLSYNRRVQRPSLFYLNPFRNEANRFSVSEGNPNLDPELSDNIELGYSVYPKASMINASIYYRRTQDIIESAISPIVEDGIDKILTTYINVGTSETFGANVFASYNPKPKWTLMTNIGVNTYNVSNDFTGVNTPTYLNYNLFLRSATTFSKGLSLEFFGVLNSPRRTFQGKTDAMVFYGAALKQEILKKKGSIGINTLNPFSRDLHIKTENTTNGSFQSSNIYYPLRSFGVNFSYSFGKLKFTEKKKIKNDDVKQEQQQGGGQMGGLQQK
ncbi:MAG: TonB-dependent receptor [Pedobacter sp.]|nr:MAG: TonB-dependent receptor [Pedobacter sp.]